MLNRAKKGDVDAKAYLYQHFLAGIFGYISRRIPNRETAEDLTSDVFLQMIEGIHTVKATNEAGFAAWLFQVARITIADYYHDREKEPPHASLEPPDSAEYLCMLERNPLEKQKYLAEVFNLLTEEQRLVLTARIMMGYDAKTIGVIIGKSANAVRGLHFRGLDSLKRKLSERKGFYEFI